MSEQVREPKVTTTYAIVDKTAPGVLYGEGTFATGAEAEETAHNLNALLSEGSRVYRAATHVVTDSLTVVGEESEYEQAPKRSLVNVDADATEVIERPVLEEQAPEQAIETPVEAEQPIEAPVEAEQHDEVTGEPQQPGEFPADPFARR